MAGLVCAITIMLIFSTMAFQAWEDVIRRDNEAEMIFRAKEITRGILRYRRDHGGMGPLTLEQLAEPGPQGQYYIRRLYEDPLVKDGKWGLLYSGPGGNIIDPSLQPQQQSPAMPGLGQLNQAQSRSQDIAQVGQDGGMGAGIGIPIAGVKTLSTDEPFRHYNGVADYSQWQFTYIDLETGFAQVGGGRRGGRTGLPGQQGAVPGGQQGGSIGNQQGSNFPNSRNRGSRNP
jgi:hypothetical protein